MTEIANIRRWTKQYVQEGKGPLNPEVLRLMYADSLAQLVTYSGQSPAVVAEMIGQWDPLEPFTSGEKPNSDFGQKVEAILSFEPLLVLGLRGALAGTIQMIADKKKNIPNRV